MSRLKDQYQNEIVDAMIKKFGYKNIMEVPKLDKVVINMGVGEAKDNAKLLESAIADMEKIAGQKAVVTRAKNSVANFKIREGMPIGCKVTLRGEKMYEFVDRLINLALPRVSAVSASANWHTKDRSRVLRKQAGRLYKRPVQTCTWLHGQSGSPQQTIYCAII